MLIVPAKGKSMCERCKAIDIEVRNFKRLHAQADDQLALALIAEAIADLEAEKASLHPGEKERE
jgi:hypothetical protein